MLCNKTTNNSKENKPKCRRQTTRSPVTLATELRIHIVRVFYEAENVETYDSVFRFAADVQRSQITTG